MGNLLTELEAVKSILAAFQGVDLAQLEADVEALGTDGKALVADVSVAATALGKLLTDLKAQLPSTTPKA
jgi:hypothetical protein